MNQQPNILHRRHRVSIILLIAIFCIIATVPAISSQQCLKDVRNVFQILNFPKAGKSDKAYFIEFTSITTMRDTTNVKNISLTTSMLVSGSTMRVKSSEMDIYQDTKHIVVISPKQKTVLIRNYSPVEDQRSAMGKILFLQDTVFNSCIVRSCKSIKSEDGSTAKEVQLELKKGYFPAFSFNALTVIIDPVKQMLKKATVYYTPLQPIQSISVIYHTINYNYPIPKDVAKPALSFVLQGNKLLPKYSQYRLIDVR